MQERDAPRADSVLDGKLAEWPPRRGAYQSGDYDAPRPGWLLLQNALARMPYSGGLGTPLRAGLTVDEAFASLVGWADRLAESLRHAVKMSDANDKELAKHRAFLWAEIEREEMLEEMRQARERQRLENIARGG